MKKNGKNKYLKMKTFEEFEILPPRPPKKGVMKKEYEETHHIKFGDIVNKFGGLKDLDYRGIVFFLNRRYAGKRIRFNHDNKNIDIDVDNISFELKYDDAFRYMFKFNSKFGTNAPGENDIISILVEKPRAINPHDPYDEELWEQEDD
jgi:hypothetical protein